jgi:hypothetical protein
MANQVPLATFGLEEAVEQFAVQKIETIMESYAGQQIDSVVTPLVASLWTKLEKTQYPFLGVRAYMPELAPMFLGDTVFLDADGAVTTVPGALFQGQFNDCLIAIHIESKSYRELQRLSSYIWFTIDKDFDPYTNQSYLSEFADAGILINGWRQSPVTRVILDTLQREGDDRNVRTDLETLFQRDITANCNVNVNILTKNGIPIILVDVSTNLNIII